MVIIVSAIFNRCDASADLTILFSQKKFDIAILEERIFFFINEFFLLNF